MEQQTMIKVAISIDVYILGKRLSKCLTTDKLKTTWMRHIHTDTQYETNTHRHWIW